MKTIMIPVASNGVTQALFWLDNHRVNHLFTHIDAVTDVLTDMDGAKINPTKTYLLRVVDKQTKAPLLELTRL